jgi:hypothetical protein
VPFSLAHSAQDPALDIPGVREDHCVPTPAIRPDAPGLCFVCGLDLTGLDELPWGEDGDSPTFNYCPCCGVEFGYGDATIEAAKTWRDTWLASGGDWVKSTRRPGQWDAALQLAGLPKRAR